MASYRVVIDRRVRKKDLPELSRKDVERISKRIGELAAEPHPPNADKLTDRPGFRLRQGNYRILYSINDRTKTISVTRVAHRREVYR